MVDFLDPKINRKKRQKLIKLAYEEIDNEIEGIKPLVPNSSLIKVYWDAPEEERTNDLLETIFTTEYRVRNRQDKSSKSVDDLTQLVTMNVKGFERCYQDMMNELLISDRASKRNIPKSYERKDDAIGKLNTIIKIFNIETKIKWLEYCINNKFFTEQTITRFKLKIYSSTDALNTDEGRILSEMCIDNDLESIQKLIDEDLSSPTFNPIEEGENYKLTVSRGELEKLKELIEKGEPFYVYRGFLVDKDEYVRGGKKSSGADYWKQVGGQGLSYSLNKDIAIYFTYWKLIHNERGEVANTVKKIPLIHSYFPNSLISKEEYLEGYTQEIYELRENEINNERKPIVCKYLVDPADIKGFVMDTNEAEVMIRPEDVVVENYTILSSKQIAEGVWGWRCVGNKEWREVTAIYNKKGIVVLPIKTNMGEEFIFADGEKVNDLVEEKKDKVRNGGEFSFDDDQELQEHFKKNAVEIPIDEYKLNPVYYTKDINELLLSKKKPNLKHRVGRIYEWSKEMMSYLREKINKQS